MKITILESKKRNLMIHSFSSNVLPGDGISINIDILFNDNLDFNPSFIEALKSFNCVSFDDGLYQQYPLIKLFNKYIETYFFPSGNFIRKDTNPTIVHNALAHEQFHKTKTYPNTFLSSDEIWDLLNEGIKFGIHGWFHYNMNPIILANQTGKDQLKDILLILKDDARRSVDFYFNLIMKNEKLFITDGILTINYCTPYNVNNEYQKLYIGLLRGYILKKLPTTLTSKINEIIIVIFSNERISLEKFLGEQYAIK